MKSQSENLDDIEWIQFMQSDETTIRHILAFVAVSVIKTAEAPCIVEYGSSGIACGHVSMRLKETDNATMIIIPLESPDRYVFAGYYSLLQHMPSPILTTADRDMIMEYATSLLT